MSADLTAALEEAIVESDYGVDVAATAERLTPFVEAQRREAAAELVDAWQWGGWSDALIGGTPEERLRNANRVTNALRTLTDRIGAAQTPRPPSVANKRCARCGHRIGHHFTVTDEPVPCDDGECGCRHFEEQGDA